MKRLSMGLSIFFVVMVLACMGVWPGQPSVSKDVYAQEPEEGESVPNPYDYIYIAELFDEGLFSADSGVLTFKKSDNNKGVFISGKCDALSNAVFTIDKQYDFGVGSPNRVRIDALAEAGVNVYAELYRKDSTVPFARKKLNNVTEEDGWSEFRPVFINLEDDAIGGQDEIYLKFDIPDSENSNNGNPDSNNKDTQVYIKNLRFYKATVPTVSLEIDESLGTIAAMNSSVDHSVRCYGKVNIKVPSGYSSEYMAEGETYTGGTYDLEYMRGRGHSTWLNEGTKKPYKIKLNKKANLFGMGKSKEYALIANYFDNSLIRNRITYYLGQALEMPYSPRLVPVDLIMNGEYMGSYYLSEIVDVGSSRVDVNDLEEITSDDADISGGYLLAVRPYETSDDYSFASKRGTTFEIVSPSKIKSDQVSSDKPNEMQAYIEDYINKTEDAIFGEDFKDGDGVAYTDYMDLEAAAKYYLIQEFSMNEDAYLTSSTYMYKDANGKLCWGPLWDFDLVAWADRAYVDYDEETDSYSRYTTIFPWFERLSQDPEFRQEVKEVWGDKDTKDSLYYQLNELVKEGGVIDQYKAELDQSAANNFDMPKISRYPIGENISDEELENSVCKNYSDEVERLRSWIIHRMKWVDENIDSFGDNNYIINFYDDDELVLSAPYYPFAAFGEFPEVKKDGYYFEGWTYDSEEGTEYEGEFVQVMNPYDVLYGEGEMNFRAKWVKKEDAVEPSSVAFEEAEYTVEEGMGIDLFVNVTPEDADSYVTYSIDKPGMVTLSPDGFLCSKSVPGDVTITATTINGISASCTIHIIPVEQGAPSSDNPDDPDDPEEVPNPYTYNYFGDMLDEGTFTADNDKVTIQKSDDDEKGVVISGKCKNLNAAVFTIDKEYDFGVGRPNRVRIDGYAKDLTSIYVELYRKGENEPFARKRLNNTVEYAPYPYYPIFIELEEGDIGGQDEIYLKFDDITDTGKTETELFLKSIKFYKESVPTVNLEIDENLGTIEQMHNSSDHSKYCYGYVNIKVPDGYSSEYMADGETFTGGRYKLEYVRGRGNSTWTMARKRPYKIKLEDTEKLFGMGKSKEYALIANFFDNSLIRNRITYYLGNALDMPYSPKLVPVDLTLNGEYYGSYYLSELIDVEDSRVGINDLEKIKSDDEDISGGYLLAVNPYENRDEYVFASNKGVTFQVDSPSKIKSENVSPDKLDEMNAYIEDYVNRTEAAIYSDDFCDEEGVSYTEYMDLEAAAKYYLIQEFTMNGDAYNTTSTYLYKDRGGKLCWGPLWDFDYVAWADTAYEDYDEKSGSYNYYATNFPWFERLKNDPAFVQAVKDAWGDMDDENSLYYQLNELVKDGGIIDQYKAELEGTADNNFDIPGVSEYIIGEYLTPEELEQSICKDYAAEVERLRSWIKHRMQWVDENIDDLHVDAGEITFYDGDEVVEVRTVLPNTYIGELPKMTKDGYYFDGWYSYKYEGVEDEEGNPYEVIPELMSPFDKLYGAETFNARAKWVSKDEVAEPEGVLFARTDYYVNEYGTVDLNATVVPEGAKDTYIEYTIDRPTLCQLNAKGQFSALQIPGDVQVTATTVNGLSATCTVHILKNAEEGQFLFDVFVDPSVIEMKVGEYRKVNITYEPEDTLTPVFNVTSFTPNIAYITEGGVVFACSPGEAIITLGQKGTDEFYEVRVIVSEPEEDIDPDKNPDKEGQGEGSGSGGGQDSGSGSGSGTDKGSGEGSGSGTDKGSDSGSGSGSDQGSKEGPSKEWIDGLWYNEDGTQTYTYLGSWKCNDTGWWYEDENGWYPQSMWQKIDGVWYYFDEVGYMASNEWREGYWLSSNGALEYEGKASWKVNSKGWWYEDDKDWYAKDQWMKIDGYWYYFGASGYMLTSQYIDGYWLGSDGRMTN